MLDTLLQKIETLKNDEIATHSQRFFKTGTGEYGEGDRFLGIRVPILRQLAKAYSALSHEETLTLLQNPYHEVRLLALFILTLHFEKSPSLQIKTEIYTAYLDHTTYINNWDLVDSSAHKIVGAYLLDKDRNILYALAASALLWERRIAVIATLWFIKHGEFTDTLQLSKRLLNDREDLMHKAVGWALREVGKKEKSLLIEFLEQYHKIMPRTMLRYALEKCSKEEKVRYMAKI